ncbi:MAG: class I SAM-dependent methyltransferase [Candidatus Dormiibacterota bacterium]
MQDREQRLVFGEVAELYERHRPGYPEAAFDRIMEFGQLHAGDRVLEVGAGTGRATLPLAGRGLQVTALEPSPEMARIARRSTAGYPGVLVEESAFEPWPLPDQPFAVVVSAQAWHWLDPEIRFGKAHQALRPDGGLALLWNRDNAGGDGQDVVASAIEAVYQREAPNLGARVPSNTAEDRQAEIETDGLFGEIQSDEYLWSVTYSTEEYLGLLQTQSDHRLLDPAVLGGLLEGIAGVLAGHGDVIQQKYRTDLYLARRLE